MSVEHTDMTIELKILEAGYVLDGERFTVQPGNDPHMAAMAQVSRSLAGVDRPVRVRATDEDGTRVLEVFPGGRFAVVDDDADRDAAADAEQASGDPWAATAPTTAPDAAGAAEEAPEPDTAADDVDAAYESWSHDQVAGEAAWARQQQAKEQAERVAGVRDESEWQQWMDGGPQQPAAAGVSAGGDGSVDERALVQPVALDSRRHRRAGTSTTAGVSGVGEQLHPVDSGWEGDDVVAPVSFLSAPRPDAAPPTSTGFVAWLERMGWRKPAGPSQQELARRADLRLIAQHWPGPRTIAVINGKGGANKTPTTAMLAAFFARLGGAGVLAWDNNQTRGTLGWRTEQGPHEATVADMLGMADQLLAPDARAADLAGYVHHQTVDQYDVLRSNPQSVRPQDRITAEQLQLLHRVASRYYRVIVMDSGNDEAAPNWLSMIDHADVLVVATTTNEESAENGRLALHNLCQRDARSEALAASAVTIVSHGDPQDPAPQGLARQFERLCAGAVTIPFDRALRARHVQIDALAPGTQTAWRSATATVAQALTDSAQVLGRVAQ